MTTEETLLAVRGLGVAYGGIRAVRDVSFEVRRGEIVTLIGGNGAGKSSILRAISGIVPHEGAVLYEGRDLARVPAHTIVGLGIAQVPEGRGIFGNLSVAENLRLATWQRRFGKRQKATLPQPPPLEGGESRFKPSPSRGEGRVGVEIANDLDRVFAIFPRLKERLRQPGGTLSGGEQQMLAVGRALMCRPRLLLLDEPSMGLAPLLVREIFRVLGEINAAGTTILLVEQNANMALHVAHRGHVLETGAIVRSGTGQELLGDPAIRTAYLGG
jgi:branched-chain amino acid transport system ATP-binding protein